MESLDVPTNFVTVINDFANDLSTTFPEYNDKWDNLTKEIDVSSRDELYKHCMTVYPERFFDILYQNADIFSDKQDTNVNFLPNVDFKILYNSDGVTENIRKTIWKYLQLVLFTVVGSVKDKSIFGDSMNMFEGIDEKDLQAKLGETMEGLTDFFKDMGKNESSESSESASPSEEEPSQPFNMNGMPNMENMQEHLHTLFNGKIGSLAKEMAEEISGDFTELLGDNAENANPQDIMKKLMKNPTKIMGLMKSVTGKLDAKMKSGEISRDELMKEAGDLLGKMKESTGGAEMSEMFAKMAKSMGGMGKNMKMDTNAIERMVKSTKLKEDMMNRHSAKKDQMLERAREEAALVQQRIDAQEKLMAKCSLEQKDGTNMVFKFNGESSQEKSFIHPDLLKDIEADELKKTTTTNKPKKKKKKGKK
mgnify:FL=1|tara:strand:+ start:409 stop:1671 length:1263 start_codon:yes stop_codon:yes gene_type:complete